MTVIVRQRRDADINDPPASSSAFTFVWKRAAIHASVWWICMKCGFMLQAEFLVSLTKQQGQQGQRAGLHCGHTPLEKHWPLYMEKPQIKI